jgi:hypothetical protein
VQYKRLRLYSTPWYLNLHSSYALVLKPAPHVRLSTQAGVASRTLVRYLYYRRNFCIFEPYVSTVLKLPNDAELASAIIQRY